MGGTLQRVYNWYWPGNVRMFSFGIAHVMAECDYWRVNPLTARPLTAPMIAGADNAMRRRFALNAAIIMRSGCEDIRPGDRLE